MHIVCQCFLCPPFSPPPPPAGHEKLLRLFEVERPDAAPVELQGANGVIRAALFVGPGED